MKTSLKAKLLLEWQELEERQNEILKEIGPSILEDGKFVMGIVTATVSNPRKKYDYEKAADSYTGDKKWDSIVDDNTLPVTNWLEVCKDLEISKEDVPFVMQGETKVVIKMKEEK